MMRLLIFFAAFLGFVTSLELVARSYHKTIGIPEAHRIREAEERTGLGSRIVGGTLASLGQYPFLGGLVITLTNGATSVCGSSLLTPTRLVTAAHCWWDGSFQARQFLVVLGSTTLFSGGTRITTTNVFLHPNYFFFTYNNDIAVVTVPWVTYTSNIQPISLPDTSSEVLPGSWVRVAGFGRTSDSTGITSGQALSHVSVEVISNWECAAVYGTGVVVESTLCTSGAGEVGTCGGDSGGPVVATLGGETVLVGVVSFGADRGCQLGLPSGHSRVVSHVSWIQTRL